MTLTPVTNGPKLLTAVDQDLFSSQTNLKHYEAVIYVSNLVANDIVIITVYDNDITAAAEVVDREIKIVGSNPGKTVRINWIPSTGFRVAARQIQGSFKTINFTLYNS